MELNRRFSPITLLIISINGMIGSAWLFAPLYAARIAGSQAIVSWIIAGLATMIIALTFAELSVLIPKAGGTAEIPMMSHGTFTSFTLSWIAWLSALTMAPIEVQAVLQYASTYFTSLTYTLNGVTQLTPRGLIWATFLMLCFCTINSFGSKELVRSNFLIFSFKVIVIILTILMFTSTKFYPTNFSELHSGYNWHAILTAVATAGIAFAFTGFKHGVELAGEAKNVAIAVPLAIVGSVLICLLLYLGLQIALIGVLSPEQLSNGWSLLKFTDDVGPFAGLAAGLGLAWLLKLLYIDAVVSPGGAGMIYVASTARLLYAMSQIGYMPQFLSYLNKEKFPVAAIFINFLIGMFLFLPLPGWQAMVSFLVSGMVLSYGMGPIALLSLRLSKPHETRKFRLPMAKWICLISFYFCNLIAYWTGWDTLSKLAIAIVIGFGFFLLALLKKRVSKTNLGLRSLFWMMPYLAGLILISYLGAFGGKNIITFGWDFFVIGLFSIVILYLAVKYRLK